MGVDWHSLVSTLIPIVIAILKSLIPSEDE
jgi:hypothetical protein